MERIMLDKNQAYFPEGSFEAALEMLAIEHPVELKLKGVEQLTKMVQEERKIFTENNVLAIWSKISAFDSMSQQEIYLTIMKFISEISKCRSRSTILQKFFLEFLCNDAILNYESDNVWSCVTTNVTFLLNDIVLPENYLALSKALIFLSSMYSRAPVTLSEQLKASIASAVTAYSDFVDNDVLLICFRSAISHLTANPKNETCFRDSSNLLCTMLKSKPTAFNLETVNEVIFLCRVKEVLENFHLIEGVFEEMLNIDIWRHFVYLSFCEVLKSVASSFRYLPCSILKLLDAYLNTCNENMEESCEDFEPLLEMVLEVLTHVQVNDSYIDQQALMISKNFLHKSSLELSKSGIVVSSSFYSRFLIYDIFGKIIDRQKQKEKTDQEIRYQFEEILTQEVERVISLTDFELVESLKLLHLLDSSFEVTSFDFKVKFFEFGLRTVSKTFDCDWLKRFQMYLKLCVGRTKHGSKHTELLKLMKQLLGDSKVMNMYEQEILSLLLSMLQQCKERHPSLLTNRMFELCFEFCRLRSRCNDGELLICLCELVLGDNNGKSANTIEFLDRFFVNVLDLEPRILEEYSHNSLDKRSCTIINILNKASHLIQCKHEDQYVVKPGVRSRVLCFFINPGLLRAFDQLCASSSVTDALHSLEATIVLGLKLVLECLRSETDWNVFSAICVQLSYFLRQQETVEKIFGNRVLKGISDSEGNNDLILSLGCTYLEQLVIELCSLVDVKSFAFKKRFEQATLAKIDDNQCQFIPINDQISAYRALIFQCLMYMVTYKLDVKQRRIVSCFVNGMQDLKCSVTCLSALTICILEYPVQSCSRHILPILDNIFKMKSSRSMSVPALNFIFMLSQLPTLRHNFRCEDHKQVMMVILQFVDYSSYSKYCAEVALNLLSLWFLKCKVSYRTQLAKLIVTELRGKLLKLQQDVKLLSKCTTSKTGASDTICGISYPATTINFSEHAEVETTKSDTNKTSLSQLAVLQEVALNLCQDMVSRNLFSDSSQMTPKRSTLADMLLANGLTKTWIYNERIITITTSGESYKVMSNGLCRKCNERVSNVTSAAASVSGAVTSDRIRHKSTPQTPNVDDQRSQSIINEGIEMSTNTAADGSSNHQCACWISGWSEVYIRTATGDMSFLNRTQLQHKANVISNLDFPLEKLGLLMPTLVSFRAESGDMYSQASSCSSVEVDEAFESCETFNWSKPRMSIALVGVKNKLKLEANLVRSKSLDDVSQLLNDSKLPMEKNKRKSSCTCRKQQMQSGNVKRRHESGFALGSRNRHSSGDHASQFSTEVDQSDPSHIFAQIFAASGWNTPGSGKSVCNQSKLVLLPDVEDTKDDLNYFDNYLPISAHKVGVLYVDVGQADESAILGNICGSERYTDFIKGLGSVVSLSDYSTHNDLKLYTGGLDKSSRELDGKFALCWVEEFFHIVFHVATLMPTPAETIDPQCRRKKALIGNDSVVIVYNDSKSQLNEQLIETDLNFITILITPTDGKRSSVRILFKRELEPWVIHASREEKIVSDKNLAVYVRQMALHASMACHGYLFRQKNLDYTSNWSKRLALIRKMRAKYAAKNLEYDPLSDLV